MSYQINLCLSNKTHILIILFSLCLILFIVKIPPKKINLKGRNYNTTYMFTVFYFQISQAILNEICTPKLTSMDNIKGEKTL